MVYQVPQSLRDTKPEAYNPQTVGLGPYHHLRPEVQEMESQKRAAVRNYLKVTDLQTFRKFVDGLTPKEEPKNGEMFQSTIASYYDRYLDLDSKTLIWIVVIDGIFLLHFLRDESSWKNQRLVADIMMLENQIPRILLGKIRIALKEEFPDAMDIQLLDQFYGFCKKQSPLKFSDRPEVIAPAFEKGKHMVDFLYHLIVNNYKSPEEIAGGDEEEEAGEESLEEVDEQPASCLSYVGDLRRTISRGGDVADDSGIIEAQIQDLEIPDNIKKAFKLLHQLKKTSYLCDSSTKLVQHRLADKIVVPSVSQLHRIAKIKFACADGGIKNMNFHENMLYLPELTLGETSEVVLRNLVAYEAASAEPGTILELAEYVDLMCGIIDTEIDVNLLRRFKIIKGNLADKEIVRIFNGINKSIERPNKETRVQMIVKDLNKKFRDLRIVKAYKFIYKSFAAFLGSINLLFPILVLILLFVQTFCETYGCSSRPFGYATVPEASSSSLDSQAKLTMPRKLLGYDL